MDAPSLRPPAARGAAALALSALLHAVLAFAWAQAGPPPSRHPTAPTPAVGVVHVRLAALPPRAEPVRAVEAPAPRAAPVEPRRVSSRPRVNVPTGAVREPVAEVPAVTVADPQPSGSAANAHIAIAAPRGIAEPAPVDAAVAALQVPAYLDTPPPEYPALAREDELEGVVVLRVLVSREGRARQVELHRSSGHGVLDAAALAGVRRWTFRAARRGGEDIEAWLEVPVRFALR